MTKPDDDTRAVPVGPRADGTNPDPHPTAELPPVNRSGDGSPDGWADDRTTVPVPAGSTGRGLRGLAWLAGIIVVVVALLFGSRAVGLWPHLGNPFASRTTDRSQPVLLKSIQDLHRFVGASGNFQVVIDVQKDRRYIPDVIFNDRTLFVAAGTVDAYVDFSGITSGALAVDQTTKTVTLKLPAPQMEKANIDHQRSYVFAEQQGIVNHIGDLFGGDPNKQQQLYVLAEQRIGQAARDSGLGDRARQNTQAMLVQMIKALGYTTVNVTFAQP